MRFDSAMHPFLKDHLNKHSYLSLSEEEKVARRKYPKTKLSGASAGGISVAFVFLPNGPQVFEGRKTLIIDHLSNYPTSHGILLHYIFGHGIYFGDKNKRIINREWRIFGKDHEKYMFERDRQSGRSMTRLFYEDKIIGQWRKLPQKHLKQLKKINKYTFIQS